MIRIATLAVLCAITCACGVSAAQSSCPPEPTLLLDAVVTPADPEAGEPFMASLLHPPADPARIYAVFVDGLIAWSPPPAGGLAIHTSPGVIWSLADISPFLVGDPDGGPEPSESPAPSGWPTPIPGQPFWVSTWVNAGPPDIWLGSARVQLWELAP